MNVKPIDYANLKAIWTSHPKYGLIKVYDRDTDTACDELIEYAVNGLDRVITALIALPNPIF